MWRLSLLSLAACNSLLGVHDFSAELDAAPIDVPFVPSDAMVCVGSAHAPLHQCGVDDNTTVTLSSPYSTTDCPGGTRIPDTTPPRCVIFAHAIAEPETFVVTGDATLVLFAIDTIAVTTLDGSSTRSAAGPGASSVTCKSGDGKNGNSGGGGAGGSFISKGGDGGSSGGGTNGGSAADTSNTGVFLPGCAGGDGGGSPSGSSDGGRGGGAIYLAANHGIAIATRVAANGAPGRGGNPRLGGGGGGAGGSIFIDAPMLTCQATPCLLADGSGGGGGGGAAIPGDDGGTPGTTGLPASGGTGSSGGMGGGTGGNGNTNLGAGKQGSIGGNNNTANSGGGGGGGAGQIVIFGGATVPLGGSIPTSVSGG